MKKAFTLIELLIVIAVIAIIATLAVGKFGGVREAAARKVSFANQKAVERAVEAYLAGEGRLNRLDSLLYAGDGGVPITGGTEHDFDFTAVSRTPPNLPTARVAMMPMMAITISSSMSVNAFFICVAPFI